MHVPRADDDPAPRVACDWSAPIVVVGAGRSGTTRIGFTLGEHSDVYMIGETSFLLPRLWHAFFERPEYVDYVRIRQLVRHTRPEWREMLWETFRLTMAAAVETPSEMLADIQNAETARLHRLFAAFFAETLIPPSLRTRRWGFKEIWAGGDAFPGDWTLYRAVFPRASFIHSVRHPFAYLRSTVSNMGIEDPSDDYLTYMLAQWVRMVRHAQTLRDTGRYFQCRMEDFDLALPRMLQFLDLPPDPRCVAASRLRYAQSARREVALTAAMASRVDGLHALADELGYDLSDESWRAT